MSTSEPLAETLPGGAAAEASGVVTVAGGVDIGWDEELLFCRRVVCGRVYGLLRGVDSGVEEVVG